MIFRFKRIEVEIGRTRIVYPNCTEYETGLVKIYKLTRFGGPYIARCMSPLCPYFSREWNFPGHAEIAATHHVSNKHKVRVHYFKYEKGHQFWK